MHFNYSFSDVDISKEIYNNYCLHYTHYDCDVDVHSHDFYEINIILGGKGKHNLQKNTIDAYENCVFVIPPKMSHGYRLVEKGFDVFHIILSDLFFLKFGELIEKLPEYRSVFINEPQIRSHGADGPLLVLNEKQSSEILNIIKTFEKFDEVYNNEQLSVATTIQLISLLCLFFSELYANTEGFKNEEQKMFLSCMNYINDYLETKLSISDLAKRCFMSENNFIRKFKKFTGVTPAQYINICRVKKAKELLQNTELSVVRIAMDCGFFDSSHFSKKFKEYYKITPKQFRKQIYNKNV